MVDSDTGSEDQYEKTGAFVLGVLIAPITGGVIFGLEALSLGLGIIPPMVAAAIVFAVYGLLTDIKPLYLIGFGTVGLILAYGIAVPMILTPNESYVYLGPFLALMGLVSILVGSGLYCGIKPGNCDIQAALS